MTTASTRKRKHVPSASTTSVDNDTIVVTPYRAIERKNVREQPARRTRKRVHGATQEESSAAHIRVGADASQSTSNSPPRPTSNESPNVIPRNCCRHCLTRGGNGAYECAKADGQEYCSRCIRDKRKKCRLPTDEEAAQIAARCPRCTKRGFTGCNGGNPCDTCIRNKTPELCQLATKRVLKKDPVSSEPLATARPTDNSNTPDLRFSARRRSRRRSLPTSQTTEGEKSTTSKSSTGSKRTRRRARAVQEVAVEEGTVQRKDSTPSEHESELFESDLRDLLRIEENTNRSTMYASAAPLTFDDIMEVAPSSPATTAIGSTRAEMQNLSYRPAVRQTSGVFVSALQDTVRSPSPVTFAVQTTRALSTSPVQQTSNIAKIDTAEHSVGIDAVLPPATSRPRRSRPSVSYDERIEDIDCDRARLEEPDSDTDNYSASATDEEVDEDESANSSLGDEEGHFAGEESDNYSAQESLTEDDQLPEKAAKMSMKRQTKTSLLQKSGKGIDLSLPPLDNVRECFKDLTANGVELGLGEALTNLQSTPIKVATMCSGTESPLLALDEISQALVEAGQPAIQFQHEFSAEIEPVKQSYIERNFQPKILFRDVRDFIHEEATTATTAYGAEVEIPTDINILVAGFVCKDLSRMHSRNKTLDDGGESGDTWLAIYTYAKQFQPNVVLLENVKSTMSTWKDVVARWDKIGYEANWLFADTKTYYLPQTRERMYMIAINKRKMGKDVQMVAKRWRDLMMSLRRQCSSPYEAFIADSLQEPSKYAIPLSESDWVLCKLRYDHIRSKERLGILSPVTRSSGGGTVRPPDFASRQFYESQSSRVWDAIDVAHLQGALKGSDSLYKMAVWDVSQNVDRFKADLGILPCITPSGSDFATNRQQALTGSQLLLLQGMPMGKLLFANETQKDRQDLAGNAMSTTVIGASLVAAIASCWRSFLGSDSPKLDTSNKNNIQKATAIWLEDSRCLQQSCIDAQEYRNIDLTALMDAATRSARSCHCEGIALNCKSPIRICSACGHTACTACAGNSKHDYQEMRPIAGTVLSPDVFIRSWRSLLPPRLKFDILPNLLELSLRIEDDSLLSKYLDAVRKAHLDSQFFCIGEFVRRTRHWTIEYSSDRATIELEVGKEIKWLLYLKCPPYLPGNDTLRKFLKSPIACGVVKQSLLHPAWQVRLPSSGSYDLQLYGSAEKSRSWRSRLGLLDFRDETVPSVLTVKSIDRSLAAVDGTYDYLPDCGTASSCLFKRSEPAVLYMLLDPDPIGSEADSVVFSHDHSRKHYGRSRIVVATLEPSWRPWIMYEDQTLTVAATIPGMWVTIDPQLTPAYASIDALHLHQGGLASSVLQDCSSTLLCLEVNLQELLPTAPFHAYSWALERPKTLPSISEWQELDQDLPHDCACAPSYPTLHWSVDREGIATAQEDRKAAAQFERAVKSRPPAIQINVTHGPDSTRIQVGLNVSSVLHRARAMLGRSGSMSHAWRLLTDHADLPTQPFAKFTLKSNSQDPEPTKDSIPRFLRGIQKQSLAWMIKQELGTRIVINEVEEGVHAGLNWRLEARAQAERTVRGGVLADLPSFGKSVTSIALIQNEFDKNTAESLVQLNKLLPTDDPTGLKDTAATLIVCPLHIAQQWKTEMQSFLEEEFESYGVILLETFGDLRTLKIKDIEKSRTVIVSWTVFDDDYYEELAGFVGMPEPALSSRRAFETWLGRACQAIPDQLAAMGTTKTLRDFRNSTAKLLQKNLQQPEFQVSLPVKIQHGSKYESKSVTQSSRKSQTPTTKEKAGTRRSTKSKAKPKMLEGIVPLLHLYRFNRIIVDEYHYLNDEKNIKNSLAAISIKKISAVKRWVLSGTPAMANFSDINQMASFIGIRLGRTFIGDGVITTHTEKLVKADQTQAEDFLSRTESKSRQWHQARHDQAQEFLNLFVRQNAPQLEHIACSEALLPVALDAAHHAVYLELSQHLVAQRMQLKKASKKSESDRTKRLNESLDNSSSAEVALMKSALLLHTQMGESGLRILLEKRMKQREDTKKELLTILRDFEGQIPTKSRDLRLLQKSNPATYRFKVEESIVTLYNHFIEDIQDRDWLGDSDASQCLTILLSQAKRSKIRPSRDLEGVSEEDHQKELKHQLSRLREVSRELVMRTRSERFIKFVDMALSCSTAEELQGIRCNAVDCPGSTSLMQMHVITPCGHIACSKCLAGRIDNDVCVDSSCKASLQEMSLIRMSELSSMQNKGGSKTGTRNFGNKILAIVELIRRLPDEDQGIVFVPDEEMVKILEESFDHFDITYYSPTHSRSVQKAKMIEHFKDTKDPRERRKLLILNLGSESAAGVNLTNANHIIFVSPLAARSQYEYDSAMVQAIARSRRYKQKKKVHVYHVAAERTIDVDILEHRHKRNDGITTLESTLRMPTPLTSAKERTRFIKNKKGQTALVPCSWLNDKAKKKSLGIGDSPESFTSLIRFEGAFEHEDE